MIFWTPDITTLWYAVAGLVFLFLFIMYVRSKARSPDLWGIVVDEQAGRIRHIAFIKIGDYVYASVNSKEPMFLVVTDDTRIYQAKIGKSMVPCVMAYCRGYLALPIDPKIVAAVSVMSQSEDVAGIEHEEVAKAISKLYNMEEKKTGYIRLTPTAKIAVTFNTRKIIREMLDKIMSRATEAVQHFFSTTRNIENFERYLQALSAYAVKRYSWMTYIVGIIIALAVAFAVMQGGHWGG